MKPLLILLVALAVAVVNTVADGPKLRVPDVEVGPIVSDTIVQFDLVVENLHNEKLEIEQITVLGDSSNVVVLPDLELPIEIPVGTSVRLGLAARRPPIDLYRIRCVIQIDDDGHADDTASCMITIRGSDSAGAELRLLAPDRDVFIGEQFDIPLIVDGDAQWLERRQVTGIRAQVTYHRTVLTYDDLVLNSIGDAALRTIQVRRSGSMNGSVLGSVLARLPFTACMGDRSVAQVTIQGITIETTEGDVAIDTVLSSEITIRDTWPAGPRLIERDTSQPAVTIYPNPSFGSVILSLHGLQTGATLRVYTIEGTLAYALEHRGGAPQDDVHVHIGSTLAPGLYLCEVQSNHSRVLRRFTVLR